MINRCDHTVCGDMLRRRILLCDSFREYLTSEFRSIELCRFFASMIDVICSTHRQSDKGASATGCSLILTVNSTDSEWHWKYRHRSLRHYSNSDSCWRFFLPDKFAHMWFMAHMLGGTLERGISVKLKHHRSRDSLLIDCGHQCKQWP